MTISMTLTDIHEAGELAANGIETEIYDYHELARLATIGRLYEMSKAGPKDELDLNVKQPDILESGRPFTLVAPNAVVRVTTVAGHSGWRNYIEVYGKTQAGGYVHFPATDFRQDLDVSEGFNGPSTDIKEEHRRALVSASLLEDKILKHYLTNDWKHKL